MKLSMSLLSLGLSLPFALAQQTLVAQVQFTAIDGFQSWQVDQGVCEPYYSRIPLPVREIRIEGINPDVKCHFYTDADCKGDSKIYGEGVHKEVSVKSYKCLTEELPL